MKTVHIITKPAKPATQIDLLVKVLQGGHTVTRLTAYHSGVANLTAVVATARKRGYKIVSSTSTDALNRKYTSYSMA